MPVFPAEFQTEVSPDEMFARIPVDLIYDGNIDPMESRLLCIVFLYFQNEKPVPSSEEIARSLRKPQGTIASALDRLIQNGYLGRGYRESGECVYLPAYPQIPEGHPRRQEFEQALADLVGTDQQ